MRFILYNCGHSRVLLIAVQERDYAMLLARHFIFRGSMSSAAAVFLYVAANNRCGVRWLCVTGSIKMSLKDRQSLVEEAKIA